ncbi:MAG: ATP-binding protein, partial [Candidatus Thorarchaeota archaeon]
MPRKTIGSLNGLARFMLGSNCSSIYQAWAIPKSPSRTKRFLTKRRLEAALQRSQRQETFQSWVAGSTTRTKYDVHMTSRAKQLEEEYRRFTSSTLLDCHVILAFWNGNQSRLELENALGVLFGTISQEDREQTMRRKIFTEHKAQYLLNTALALKPTSKSTQLLPQEFAPLVEIPRTEFSIPQGYTSSFSTATSTSLPSQSDFKLGYILLGNLFNNRNLDTRRIKQISLEDLRKHVAIIGTTGSGKSSTKNRIVIDAWKNGISSLLIEPVKVDARILMGAIPELRVFTLGLEQVAPFRLNPLYVEEGVHVGTHINLLVSCFMAAWPVYGILANHLRRVIVQTYVNNGWDIVHNVRGAEITLESLWYEAEKYIKTMKYGSEMRSDFRGAILARIEDLCDPARAAIFNTIAHLSIEELLSVPTIIELKHLADPDFRAFVLSLLLIRIYEHFDKLGSSDKLRNLLFIDEAHSVLEEIPKAADNNEIASARRKTTDQLVDIIAESRDLGLGVIILDQNATRLSHDALKTCHTKIIHTNTSEPDRNLLASETGCNLEQKMQIDVLRVGEVIMRGPEETVPVNIQVFYDPDNYPEMKRKWTNDDVIARMRDFYEKYSEFTKTPKPPVLLEADEVRDQESLSIAVQVEDIIQDDGFQELYLKAIGEIGSKEEY